MDRTRLAIAVAALLALGGAGALWAAGDVVQAGVAARVGAVFAAVWLAWPSLSRTSLRSWAFGGASVLIVVWRPRSAWVVLPVLALVLAWRRDRPATGPDPTPGPE